MVDEPQTGLADADAQLLAAYAAGDPHAPRAVADRFGPLAWRLAMRMLRDPAEAEDVSQEALIRLLRMAPGWRSGGARVSTWFYQVTANLCADRMRRRPAVPLEAAGDVASGDPGPEARLTAAARVAALDRALSRLPERQRLAVILRHVEGLSNAEIAAVMETGVEAVESLTARGKAALRAELLSDRAALGFDEG
jgi:RNA polymerase sigma-70 factor (ECF subfamily)